MTVAERYQQERAAMGIGRITSWEDLLRTTKIPTGKSKPTGRKGRQPGRNKIK